jgi:phospholipid/cholesterol/gamma-HCH transport system substrate-binding protein
MKFTIRYADQVVGTLIVIALAVLIFVIFMLGSSQRWFSRDYYFKTYFDSAAGLSVNMPVQYKGFTIGRLKSFDLSENDKVEAVFYIYDTYIDRVREGSLVEVIVSPIGLGNQFQFYPGLSLAPIAEGGIVYSAVSPEGMEARRRGIAYVPSNVDNISLIISRVNTLLDTVNSVIYQVENAIAGDENTTLGRTMGNLEGAVAGVETMTETLPSAVEDTLQILTDRIVPVIANLEDLTFQLRDPKGTVGAFLQADGDLYLGFLSALDSATGVLGHLEKTASLLPKQVPQLELVISDLRGALKNADDVLQAVKNNPLLKNGVPQGMETGAGGTSPRDIEF